jgi:hypothetical protein
MGGEYALYVMVKGSKTPAKTGFSGLLRPQANLDATAICPYTSAVPPEWTSF